MTCTSVAKEPSKETGVSSSDSQLPSTSTSIGLGFAEAEPENWCSSLAPWHPDFGFTKAKPGSIKVGTKTPAPGLRSIEVESGLLCRCLRRDPSRSSPEP